MSNITASDVNKLRKSTGAGIMDCKKALVEANGDFDLAIENLRKKRKTRPISCRGGGDGYGPSGLEGDDLLLSYNFSNYS